MTHRDFRSLTRPKVRTKRNGPARTLQGTYRTVGAGTMLRCIQDAGIKTHLAMFVDSERVHSYLVPSWAWFVFRKEVFDRPLGNETPGFWGGIVSELRRLNKDVDARCAYLAMAATEHQISRNRWFDLAREILEGGWE